MNVLVRIVLTRKKLFQITKSLLNMKKFTLDIPPHRGGSRILKKGRGGGGAQHTGFFSDRRQPRRSRKSQKS